MVRLTIIGNGCGVAGTSEEITESVTVVPEYEMVSLYDSIAT